VKILATFLALWAAAAWGAEPVLKPEAQARVQKNLGVVKENLERARRNLAAATHNVDVITSELTALDKLQREHEALKAKYQNVEEKGGDPEKAKALLKGVQEGIAKIEAQRGPLQNQLATWKERQTLYDEKIAEFEKKQESMEVPPQLVSPDLDQ
jgi:chromosome segregation ATPase